MPQETPSTKKEIPLSERKGFQRLIETQKIQPKDFGLIEELTRLDQRLIIVELHNFFDANAGEEYNIEQLEQNISLAEKYEQRGKLKRMYELMLEFTKKYGSHATVHLVRFLEGEVSD